MGKDHLRGNKGHTKRVHFKEKIKERVSLPLIALDEIFSLTKSQKRNGHLDILKKLQDHPEIGEVTDTKSKAQNLITVMMEQELLVRVRSTTITERWDPETESITTDPPVKRWYYKVTSKGKQTLSQYLDE